MLRTFVMQALLVLAAVVTSAEGADGYVVPGVETGEVLMTVHVWGEVRSPGTVLIPVGSDLVAALSAAGGPTGSADLGGVRVVYESGPDSEYDLDDYLDGEGDPVPVLTPGATVYVRQSRTAWWKDTIDFAYKIIVAVNLVWILAER